MASINDIIKREVNPFDLVNLKTGNFWGQNQELESVVESIHQEAITEIEGFLDLVARDNRSRTVLLVGDAGSGKSYLLSRLKHTFNSKAFFAYIGPWVDNDYMWRHLLRNTVDSLIQVPEGQEESQLILWLKNLSIFTKTNLKKQLFNDSFWQLLLGDRQKFINHLKKTYLKAGIYNPDVFFGVLHDLTDPELYPLACEWLRGDNLSEESMQALRLRHCIDAEDAAKNILANFGKISSATQPIVLCFDQVETLPNWTSNPQPLFNINTTIHSENLKNFLIIISIVTNGYKQSYRYIQQSDKARIDRLVSLKPINLNQAEALWAYRLQSIHQQANPKPDLPIFPLNRQLLQENFPGGKTMPRTAFIIGRLEYQEYKLFLLKEIIVINIPSKTPEQSKGQPRLIDIKIVKNDFPPNINDQQKEQAEFQLIWQQEYKKVQDKIAKISLLAAPDLIRMVQETLEALQVQTIKPKLISGTYASYSLSYQLPSKRENIGIVWTEDANMNSFYNVMNACQRAIQNNLCQTLYLIRIASVGNAKLVGNQIYSQIFTGTKHIHLKPNLASVHYLATYHSLVNSSLAQELVVAGKAITLSALQSLIRESKILEQCTLLQDLGILAKQQPEKINVNKTKDLRPVKDFLLNLVKTQGYMGVPTLISQGVSQFSYVEETETKHLIDLLCQENKVKIINPKSKLEDQLIRLLTN
ncbi:ATP-binding protein [Desmonostoc muscorum LEGE 12446]|uniref:ATP-binding protein n=1 Tax=Desmonostoc muscorum LEGE 12446 TaxID=1828758 RepID=A0A8J6ZY92_DESMC|nr:ATP-binding protein [Desmonostoc muscorum]MCF2149977.1 ATP-binding protein [Desmonostoc muscorum LEGE 12446]